MKTYIGRKYIVYYTYLFIIIVVLLASENLSKCIVFDDNYGRVSLCLQIKHFYGFIDYLFQVLTKDSVTVTVDAVVFARIIHARTGALSGVFILFIIIVHYF